MPATRITERFANSSGGNSGALLPYFTAGFPDGATTAEVIRAADAVGAVAVEIGVPYSDSIADGPIIQGSFTYVLDHGWTLEDTFNLVSEVRPAVGCGLIAMLSYSIVHRVGVAAFMTRAADAGFDGIIVPDLPVEESGVAYSAARSTGLCHVGLIAPTTSATRREAIIRHSSGFVYRIAVAGTTGERDTLPLELRGDVAELRRISELPVCVGFGVARADQIREICSFADGAIVGSAIARRIADGLEQGVGREALTDSVAEFLAELGSGLDREEA